ncbi:hypothetical protein CHARACLAT_030788 [Characodon lateralis]|uniref:Uncharacterized protein n=1 Tax=Characodon lateralis TaxID=208331 RepID=A0ABU7EFM7_9TELE|nr:hypothetical protein [Characodon lateralis]
MTRRGPSLHSHQSLPEQMGRHKLKEPLGTSPGETPQTIFLRFLGKLNQNEHACHLYCLTIVGGHFKLSFHFETGSEITLMCSTLLEKVSRAMLSLSKPSLVEACDVSITSYTQDHITSQVELDITTQDVTLVHPIYMCTLNTEPLLGGQYLLDRLAPLIDCHQDQLWVHVEVPKPLGTSSKPFFVTNHVASLEEPKEPLRPST